MRRHAWMVYVAALVLAEWVLFMLWRDLWSWSALNWLAGGLAMGLVGLLEQEWITRDLKVAREIDYAGVLTPLDRAVFAAYTPGPVFVVLWIALSWWQVRLARRMQKQRFGLEGSFIALFNASAYAIDALIPVVVRLLHPVGVPSFLALVLLSYFAAAAFRAGIYEGYGRIRGLNWHLARQRYWRSLWFSTPHIGAFLLAMWMVWRGAWWLYVALLLMVVAGAQRTRAVIVQERTYLLTVGQAELVFSDPLTGVRNRRFADRELLEIEKRKETCVLVMTDIDKFKRFNDTYGHDGGDAVLRHVAQTLTHGFGGDGVVARMGGEEFLTLLRGIPVEKALLLAESIRSILETTPVRLPGAGEIVHITASFGVAVYEPGHEIRGALFRADRALYEAKEAGRNRIRVA